METSGRNVLLKFTKNNPTLKKAVDEFMQKVLAADWKNDADVRAAFPMPTASSGACTCST